MNPLGVVARCGHRNIMITDNLREVGVVAGMGTENQTQTGILVRVHVRAGNSQANSHNPFIGKKAIQIQLQFVGCGKHQHHGRNRRCLPRYRCGLRQRLSPREVDPQAGFSIEQVLLIPVLAIALFARVERLGPVSGRHLVELFLHRDDVGDRLRTLTTHRGSLKCVQTNLAIGLELHHGHLQQFRAVLETIL